MLNLQFIAIASFLRVDTSNLVQPFSYLDSVAGEVSANLASSESEKPHSRLCFLSFSEIDRSFIVLLSYMIILRWSIFPDSGFDEYLMTATLTGDISGGILFDQPVILKAVL